MSLLDDYAPEVAEEVGRRREVEAELAEARALLAEAKEHGGWHVNRNKWLARVRAFLHQDDAQVPTCMGVSCGGTMGHYPPCPLAPDERPDK